MLALLLPALLLTGCTGDAPQATSTPTPAKSTAKAWESTYAAPVATALAPLRGSKVAAGALRNPSIAAKIDNHEAARPQLNLDRTDVVFEELVEGGLTRYVAVWQSDIPELVGPVRSVRPMDPDIIAPFGGLAAYSGGQQYFLDMMAATSVVTAIFDYDAEGLFYRSSDKRAPHNVILKATEFAKKHTKVAPPVQQFAFAAEAVSSSALLEGTPISTINTRFSTVRWPSWTWKAEGAKYQRSQEGAPDRDANGAVLTATNVVVMRVAIDGTFGEVPKTTMIGSGEAWVSSGGKTVHATWRKSAQTAPIRFVDDAGVVIRLAPGNTWIELVPVDRGSVELVK